MKIRNGFVSNSSSSSFVVAFPKKPKTAADVWKYLFDGKDGGISHCCGDGLSYSQVSEILFEDLKAKNFKEASLNDIADYISSRLDYSIHNNTISWFNSPTVDDHGGFWRYEINKYCGSNKELLEKLRTEIIRSEEQTKAIKEEEEIIIEKSGISPAPYAYPGGRDYKTGKPDTKKAIKRYTDYVKAMATYRTTNKEYIALDKKRSRQWQERYSSIDNLRKKISLGDARNFLDDNKGKFVFIISYSDNDGNERATMEHGNIFRNVPHIVINQH